ncbi:MAG: hypothetical protein J5761_02660 [Paludibacteraceae bacterium]|nr:hypothetical protein [Paludibacteraceae bacterium]
MKDEKKVTIDEIFKGLQLQMGDDYPWKKFHDGYLCWAAKCLRLGSSHARQYFSDAWSRGWLRKDDADDFCNYLIAGWKL